VARNGEVRTQDPKRTDAADATRDDDFLFYLHRGSELLQKKRAEEARVSLERAYQLSPENPKAQNLLGLVYFKLGLLEAAKSIYDRMVEQYPAEPPLYVNLGLVLLRQGRLNEAERALRKAIAISPEHVRAHCYLGLVLYRRGDLHLAREHFLKGQAEDFAKKVEQRLARTDARPSQAELLRAVAETGSQDIDASAIPFRPLDFAKDERVVRDEEAWEALVTHGEGKEKATSLPFEVNSLLPVWTLTPLPKPIAEEPDAPLPTIPQAPPRAPLAQEEPSHDPWKPKPQLPKDSPSLDTDALIARLSTPLQPAPFPPADAPPVSGPRTGEVVPPLDASLPPGQVPYDMLPTSDLLDPASLEMPEAILFGGSEATTSDLSHKQDAPEPSVPDIVNDLAHEVVTLPGFYAGPGARARLVMEDRAYLRGSAIVAASGPLTMTPAMSLLQGKPTGVHFGEPDDAMSVLEGNAILLLRVPRFAVALRGVKDLSIIASALIGFDKGFTWDNGKVLGIDVVTLRGTGSILLDTRGDPMLIPVDAETPVHAAREGLLAWSDGVRPSPAEAQSADARLFRLRGRGYVLVAFPPEPAINRDRGR
jgi:Tfp pilus assembly protein PilF